MNTIYKYPIPHLDEQEIQMPLGSEIIRVGLDPREVPCLWAIVDIDKPKAPVRVLTVGTGDVMPSMPYRHIGSFVDGSFVWHIFIG